MLKIAVLWSRCGPYHLARLSGAKGSGAEVVGLEAASDDGVYEWEQVARGRDAITTIFPGRKYHEITASEMRAGVVRALDASGCNVVAVNGWSMPEARAGIGWRWAARGRRAIVMSETKRDDNRRYWWKEWFKRRIVSRCDAALVGGRPQLEYLCRLGLDRERVLTGYDAVDNAYFAAGAETARRNAADLRREHALPEHYFLVCTRFLPRKNIDGLLRAYRRYRRERDAAPWDLVILGSGGETARLQQFARDRELEGVHWPGFVQYGELPIYYGLASVFVHPAKSEAWGLVVNEAAASGLPLLVSWTVGARHELVYNGVNGYLFDPFDVEDMAQAMLKLSGLDEQARQRMGARSATIVADWSPSNFGAQLVRAADLAFSLPDR